MPYKFNNLYTIIAREVTTDAADSMTSIIKLIERFGFGYNPQELSEKGITLGKDAVLFSAKYFVATSWYLGEKLKKETPVTLELNVVDPSGVDRGGPRSEAIIPAGMDRMNFNLSLEGLPVSGAGNYKLVSRLKSQAGEILAKGEYPFVVELVEEAKKAD
jgi:hypothetical protein